MKTIHALILGSLLIAGTTHAQWVVYDPSVHTQQIMNQAQNIAKYVEMVNNQIEQINKLTSQLQELQKYNEAFGDPAKLLNIKGVNGLVRDLKIDGYIKENPKHWDLIKAMPRERLERTVVWQQIRFNSRKQKMDSGLLRKVEENPDLKRDYENLLKHVPEDQRGRAKLSIARTLVLSQSRGERQGKNAVAV